MLQGYRLFDADAHAMMSPRMWETLPKQYFARRPRPTHVADASDMGRWTNGWLVEGQIIPHAIGLGANLAMSRHGFSKSSELLLPM